MKQRPEKKQKIAKGMPGAVLLSILIHAALFLLAGMLVVFTVVKKPEKKFEPPKTVERPKMKLRKPKVKLKKSSKPKSTTRIVTKANRANMPDLQLPEMSGMGDGLGDGVGGGFDMMPDIGDLTALGSSQSIGNDLKGVYWDLKYSRSGRYNPMTTSEFRYVFHKFFRNDWDTSIFSKYYRAPKTLYATCLVLPPSISAMAPVAFGIDDNMASGGEWIVYYKGKLVHKEGITFRFWVAAEDSLAIRVNQEVVVAASYIRPEDGLDNRASQMYQGLWHSSSADSAKYHIGHSLATVGDWITLEPGVAKDLEIVAADNPLGTMASFVVMVEEKGVEYPSGRHNGPLLPIFKTEELTHDQLDLIYQALPENEVDCINGPVFRDY